MNALPYCNSDSPSDTDQSDAEKQQERVNASARTSSGIPSADEDSDEESESMPLPLEVDHPKPHLPYVLEVIVGDQDVFHAYKKEASRDEKHNWKKFLAHGPLTFYRRFPMDMGECMFVPIPPSGSFLAECRSVQ